ncbi:hypothetical protein C8F04DRAFT_1195533 [Mycena alexandri]|uniref:Uncharacterized protein n=1 Tax=Mycena alexandri TaxID=1745969 RepID=A0AAD6S562_9AGAR|nr:hypothetical protein C8F04DRAFT_1195533 [Mycena alexandri]
MRGATSLWVIVCVLSALYLMLSPPPTASSSLAQRRTSGARQARNTALRSPYQSPREHRLHRVNGASPLRDVTNIPQAENAAAGPSLERERADLRNAERERQAALQETPSRGRRRIPGQAENRAASPTSGGSRIQDTLFIVLQRPLGLATPPASNVNAGSSNTNAAPAPTARTLAQRARREREAAARVGGATNAAPAPNARTLAQRARRDREAAAGAAGAPPAANPAQHPPPAKLKRAACGRSASPAAERTWCEARDTSPYAPTCTSTSAGPAPETAETAACGSDVPSESLVNSPGPLAHIFGFTFGK